LNIAVDLEFITNTHHEFWHELIELIESFGHSIILVTSRYPDDEIEDTFGLDVVYTSHRAKQRFCDANGIDIDAWIDGKPLYLLFDR